MYPSRYLNQVAHQDMSFRKPPGRSHRFYTGKALWRFGHGLSYTEWRYAWAGERDFYRTETAADEDDGAVVDTYTVAEMRRGITLSTMVYNVGDVDSARVVLFFARFSWAVSEKETDEALRAFSLEPPPLQSLFAMHKVSVRAGASATVTFNSSDVAGTCAFCLVDRNGTSAVRAGRYELWTGLPSDPATSVVRVVRVVE